MGGGGTSRYICPPTFFEVQPHTILQIIICVNVQKLLLDSVPIENEKTLKQFILDASRNIRNRPGTFETLRKATTKSVQVSVDVGGGHVGHLL